MDTQLRTFLTVCETMNFTQAARKLFLTQPAVSHHIHGLEKKYGLPLFSHRGRTLELTLIFGNTRELLQQLDQGKLDFALVEGYYPPDSYDHLLFRLEPFVPVCAARHPFSREPRLCRDLLGERLLVREPGSGTRNILERNLALQGITLDQFAHQIQVGNMHALIQLLVEDCGITFLYRIAVEKEAAAGRVRLLPLKDFSMVHPFDFIWPRDSIFAPEIRAVCRELMG